jgi:alpha-L-fucosidase
MPSIENTARASLQATSEGIQQFRSMPFGVSVHWGLYALLGRGEWVMHQEHIPVAEYEKLAHRFNPTGFDAEGWIDLVADAGAQALLITTKHHDGFCMYDTALTGYKVTNTPFGRDPIGELAQTCHRRGIRLHFYYSLLDWHHPDYRANWASYVEYYQGQLRELCTKYGELGGIIFDGYWPRFDTTPDTQYFVPGGAWDLAGTYDLIHSLQPGAVVANNHHVLPLKGEDYQVWELDLPGDNTTGFNTTEIGSIPRATWFNINEGWSFLTEDKQKVKSAAQLTQYLADSAARGAVCWLNVGPTPEGTILDEEAAVLRQIRTWLDSRAPGNR